MRTQPGDIWINALGDRITAEDDGRGGVVYRLTFENEYGRKMSGHTATLKLAKKNIEEIRGGVEGSGTWYSARP